MSPDEQTVYESGRDALEQDESFRDTTDAKRARLKLENLVQDHAQLERRRRQLEAEIEALEARLGDPTRELLRVGD